jgi:hypothetical protein
LCGQRYRRNLADALEGVKHRYRANGTVATKHVDTEVLDAHGELLWFGTVEAVAVVVNCDLGDDWESRSDFSGGEHGLMQFINEAEGFEDEKVSSGFGQGGDLFAKGGTGFVSAYFAERLDADAERTDGASHHSVFASGLAGKFNAALVDFAD